MFVRVFLCLISLFGVAYGQTFPTTVTVQKDLRVQGKTVLGGVAKIEDVTIYADTIHIGNLDGTGTLLVIDGSGKVTKGTAGAAGVTGLTAGDVLYGSATGTIGQENAFNYDEATNTLTIESSGGLGGVTVNNGIGSQVNAFDSYITVTDATDITTILPSGIQFSNGADFTTFDRAAGGSSHTLVFPNSQGGASTFLQNDGAGNLSWAAGGSGTVTSFSFTDGSGFDGTVTNSTTTPTLALTTTVTDDYVMFSNSGAIAGDIDLQFDGTNLALGGSAIFEGTTADANETTLTATDPTVDNTVTIQNVTGTIPMAVGTPVSLTGQTASIAATTAYTVPADGYYQVCYNATVTTAATTSCTLGPFQVRYTEATDNVVKTFPTSAVNFVNQTNRNNTDAAIGGVFTVHAKSGTNIQYIMGYATSGATAMQYNLEVTIIKIR